ncbi:UDP-N-acetylmuramoyl-L-alanyl-D-glutamate--2, 6-diaminopimelate ligase [Myxococcaceae bacterium]|nr:UDP-N-acetylmuramoyl-L-alanyl-D-glutamate--2, 6-diaminopimelate ligase [Myxococcaceae bacterium]
MRLSALLAALPGENVPPSRHADAGAEDPVIRGICRDSRAVSPGDLFVALRGSVVDGHAHVEQALELGAAALLVEEIPRGLDRRGRPVVVVRDTRRALAPLACAFFGHPSAELTLVGVTGTNGKTSVTYLVESMLLAAGRRAGVIGTVETRWPGERRRSLNTTPDGLELQRLLRTMRTAGTEAVVMEVSSHGLALGRVDGCRFGVAAFTNLTQDHLDFHGDMDRYAEAKGLLFRDHLAPGARTVLNLDDPMAASYAEVALAAGARVIGVSRRSAPKSTITLLDAETSLEGIRGRLALAEGPLEIRCPLVGDFNLENLLVATGCAHALGLPSAAIVEGLASCPQVPGRIERVAADLPGAPTVLVDYAHTPDAVDKLLRTVRPLAEGRLVTVFGCGGDRDRAKRPLMAEAVAKHSDLVIATSDNPRTEDPLAILRDVEGGLCGLRRVAAEALGGSERAYTTLPDRRSAIELALGIASARDTVVIAGKGHEDYQIIGSERLPFDDRAEARRALERARRA